MTWLLKVQNWIQRKRRHLKRVWGEELWKTWRDARKGNEEKEMRRERNTKKNIFPRDAKARCWQKKLVSREGDVQGKVSGERGVKDEPEEKRCHWKIGKSCEGKEMSTARNSKKGEAERKACQDLWQRQELWLLVGLRFYGLALFFCRFPTYCKFPATDLLELDLLIDVCFFASASAIW